MRRGIFVLAGIAALVCLVLLLGLWYDKTPKGRAVVRGELPGMSLREDRGLAAADAPVADRAAFATVVCRVEGDGEPGELEARNGEELVHSRAQGNDLILTVEPGEWSLSWSTAGDEEGADRTIVLGSWEFTAGDTRTCALDSRGVPVRGRVVDTEGRPVGEAAVEGCGRRIDVEEDGSFAGYLGVGRGRPCQLRARFEDGALSRYGPAAEVDLFSLGAPLELTVDAEPVAGLGIGFGVEAAGVRVTMVIPNSPAWTAGLEEGDLIVAVDGTAVSGLSTWDFIELGTGKEGSLVRLDVRVDDVVDQVEFRRARVSGMP